MLLENLSTVEVEQYLQEKDTILVPVGSTEQHSPYGILGTDFVVAQAVARRVGDALGILVAPTLSYGVSGHHMAFKGTVTVQPETLIRMVCDIVRSLAAHGWKRVIFINGHGGNRNSLGAAFEQLKATGLAGLFAVISWYELDDVRRVCGELFPGGEGQHATPGEVSVTRHLRPEAFHAKPVREGTVDRPDHYWPLTGEEMRKVFPDGRMESAPWLATAEHGRRVLAVAAEAAGEQVRKLMDLNVW